MACENYPTVQSTQDFATNSKVVNEVVTLDSFVTNTEASDGQKKRTLLGLESIYIQTPINGGVWASGIEFNAYNQYMIFSGVAYKPKATTSLPYTSTATPDVNFVEPFSEISSSNLSQFTDLTFDSVSAMTGSLTLDNVGAKVRWNGYYSNGDGGGNWGVVKSGAHTEDGLSIFSIDANTYVEANLKGKSINVRKAGAKGDDVTDDYSALTTAINYAESSGIKRIKWPEGQYRTSDQLILNNETNWVGFGKVSVIKPTAALTNKAVIVNTQVVNGLWSGYQSIKGIRIVNDTGIFNTNAIHFTGAVWEWELNNVEVDGFGLAGLKFERCYRGRIIRPGVYSCGQAGSEAAVEFIHTAGDRNSNIRISGGNIQDTPAGIFAARLDGAVNITFDMVTFQSNGRGINAKGTTNLAIRDCYMEDLDREVWLQIGTNGQRCSKTKIENCQMIRNTYALPILLEGDEDTLFDNVNTDGTNIAYISRNLESVRSRIRNSTGIAYQDTGSSENEYVFVEDDFYGRQIDPNVWEQFGLSVSIINENGGAIRAQTSGSISSDAGVNEGLFPLIYAQENPIIESKCRLNTISNTFFRPISLEGTGVFIRVEAANSGTGTNFVLSANDGLGTSSSATSVISDNQWSTFKLIVTSTKVELEIDGVVEATVTSNITTVPLRLRTYIVTNEAANKNFDIDYIKGFKDRVFNAV